jgi:hypothetical protein
VIAERCVELHSGVEQGFVGLLKFSDEVVRMITAVNVVAEHEHEVEVRDLAKGLELLSDLILRAIPSTAVANHREANGLRFEWKGNALRFGGLRLRVSGGGQGKTSG